MCQLEPLQCHHLSVQHIKSVLFVLFRYGFKLMIDQMLLGEITSEQEWQETLEEYDTQWYIGLEKEPEWTEAILNNTPYMFSMGHNLAQVWFVVTN